MHQLIQNCIKGMPKDQKMLYDRYSKQMYNLCLRYLKSKEDAEDAFQEGFVNVFKYLKSFSGKSSFSTWIHRIMINVCLNHLRKKKEFILSFDVDNNWQLADKSIENGLQILNKKDIYKIINDLPVNFKVCLNLFIIEGFSHKEIAEMLNIPENTSKSNVLRARKMVIEILEKQQIYS